MMNDLRQGRIRHGWKYSMTQYRLHITGVVQDVAFRWHAVRKANEYGVTGWIQNKRDGSVECVIQGNNAACQRFIVWVQMGPPRAIVQLCDVREEGVKEKFDRFGIHDARFFGL